MFLKRLCFRFCAAFIIGAFLNKFRMHSIIELQIKHKLYVISMVNCGNLEHGVIQDELI